MIPQSYKISHGIWLNNFLQVWLMGNQIDQPPLFRYIYWADEVSHIFRRRKVPENMKYLMRSFKRASEMVEIWTEENWNVKRVNSLYTMVSGRFK